MKKIQELYKNMNSFKLKVDDNMFVNIIIENVIIFTLL